MSKYHATKVTDPRYGTFDSKGEYDRWLELCLLEKAGKILGLKRQVKLELAPACVILGKKERAIWYVADFKYYDHDKGVWVWEDYKGVRTPVYRLKRRWVYARYGIVIKETGR